MIRITSIQQALNLRGIIPERALIRSLQSMGDGYSPEEHGHIIVVQEGNDTTQIKITQIKEIGDDGLFIDDIPTFEYVEAFTDGDQVTFELVYQLDDVFHGPVPALDLALGHWMIRLASRMIDFLVAEVVLQVSSDVTRSVVRQQSRPMPNLGRIDTTGLDSQVQSLRDIIDRHASE